MADGIVDPSYDWRDSRQPRAKASCFKIVKEPKTFSHHSVVKADNFIYVFEPRKTLSLVIHPFLKKTVVHRLNLENDHWDSVTVTGHFPAANIHAHAFDSDVVVAGTTKFKSPHMYKVNLSTLQSSIVRPFRLGKGGVKSRVNGFDMVHYVTAQTSNPPRIWAFGETNANVNDDEASCAVQYYDTNTNFIHLPVVKGEGPKEKRHLLAATIGSTIYVAERKNNVLVQLYAFDTQKMEWKPITPQFGKNPAFIIEASCAAAIGPKIVFLADNVYCFDTEANSWVNVRREWAFRRYRHATLTPLSDRHLLYLGGTSAGQGTRRGSSEQIEFNFLPSVTPGQVM
jgi:hypothetical protein